MSVRKRLKNHDNNSLVKVLKYRAQNRDSREVLRKSDKLHNLTELKKNMKKTIPILFITIPFVITEVNYRRGF